MASILSGWRTQALNVASNIFNTTALYGNAISQNPKAGKFLAKGLLVGLRKGFLESGDVLRTGYSPIRQKIEIPNLLERTRFKGGKFNPANYAKYVRRVMMAADAFSFEGLRSMRAFQLAWKMAAEEGKTNPDINTRNRALEILNRNDGSLEEALRLAREEMAETVAELNADTSLSSEEKAKRLRRAQRDKRRRVYEFLE
jgi:hypothetical protein